DLAADWPIRARLLRLAAHDHVLTITMHHIASDGWSMGVLSREIDALYGAFSQNQAPTLAPLSVQYADFARWQRDWLTGADLERQTDWWKAHLDGAPPLLELPYDHPRPTRPTYRAGMVTTTISATLTTRLNALAKASDASLFMVLRAAFAVLMQRWSGSDDLVIGSPVANRVVPEIEGLIGFFVNTLALRSDLSGSPTFIEVLEQTRRVCLEAYTHQDLPFEKIVAELKPERRTDVQPIVQVLFALQNARFDRFRLADLLVTGFAASQAMVRFDLEVHVFEKEGTLECTAVYATDLFEHDTAASLVRHYLHLLEQIVENATRPIARLRLATAADIATVHQMGNIPLTANEALLSNVEEAFEDQAALHPHAVALVFEDRALTYGALNARANRLAHHLITLGVQPEDRVAIVMDRSLELLIAILATLKAGGAYVPLDPSWPEARLALTLNDSEAAVVLTQQAHHERTRGAAREEVPVVALDAPSTQEIHARMPRATPIVSGRSARSLAYVIYTSGSTGTPKGAGIEHHSIVNQLVWMQRYLALNSMHRVLQKTPITFDVSVCELLLPLREGATLVIARPDAHRDPVAIYATVNEQQITTVHFVPPMLEHFTAALPLADSPLLPLLEDIVCSGQELLVTASRTVTERLPHITLHNLYGPTEAAVHVTTYTCSPDRQRPSVPIGVPVDNTMAYVLDVHGELTPVGLPGELHLGGFQVGRGYARRPGLTAERFVADPFSPEPGARMYRTGDLVRWNAHGEL
ncbi:MAG: amino acid adenylation domain-containing protein, partial [Proteobacteria bacterium]|nr:amino acid adenylation domain-containing protein [Pseudomonadota bacterium]